MNLSSMFCRLSPEWKYEIKDDEVILKYLNYDNIKIRVYTEDAINEFKVKYDTSYQLLTHGSFSKDDIVWQLNLYSVNNPIRYITYFTTVLNDKRIVIEFVADSMQSFEIVQKIAKGFVLQLCPRNILKNRIVANDVSLEFFDWKEYHNGQLIKLVRKDVFCNIVNVNEVTEDFNMVLDKILTDSCKQCVQAILELKDYDNDYKYVKYRVVDNDATDYIQLYCRWGLLFFSYGTSFVDLRNVFLEEVNALE